MIKLNKYIYVNKFYSKTSENFADLDLPPPSPRNGLSHLIYKIKAK